jgi:hypothetical protein
MGVGHEGTVMIGGRVDAVGDAGSGHRARPTGAVSG